MFTRIVIMEDTTLDTLMSMTNEAIDSIQGTKENTKLKNIDNSEIIILSRGILAATCTILMRGTTDTLESQTQEDLIIEPMR